LILNAFFGRVNFRLYMLCIEPIVSPPEFPTICPQINPESVRLSLQFAYVPKLC